MSFVSLEFFFFFPLVVFIFFNLSSQHRGLLLLLASIIFYAAGEYRHLNIIAYSMLISFFGAQALERGNESARKIILIVLLFAAFMPLFYFKYFNFTAVNLNPVLVRFGWEEIVLHDSALPIGISFYTFQLISYLVDVYHRRIPVETNFKFFSLFVLFFPHMVAGPIVRFQEMSAEFKDLPVFSYRRVSDGLSLMAWGFFKKIVIADELNLYSNKIINSPSEYSGYAVLMAMFFYSIRIYCDFSGYSDIGIGAARIFGITFPQNFDRPYFSKSIAEFWSRWHISLYNWFRDYIYFPLGGSRVGKISHYRNILAVFLLSGLWHGADHSFLIWGLINGIYIIFGNLTLGFRTAIANSIGLNAIPRFHDCLKIFITFSLITFSWIFFCAKDSTSAILIISRFSDFAWPAAGLFTRDGMAISYKSFIYALVLIISLVLVDHNSYRERLRHWVNSRKVWLRWTFYAIVILWIITSYMRYRAIPVDFIYFQF